MEALDSRDLEEEIETLEETHAGSLLTREEDARLTELLRLRSECDGYGWEHGIQLIPVADFTEYAQELAEDCGDIPNAGSDRWPLYCIDWEYAARELSHDYSLVTFEGIDYYWREI